MSKEKEIAVRLASIADKLDKHGYDSEANTIDKIILKLAQKKKRDLSIHDEQYNQSSDGKRRTLLRMQIEELENEKNRAIENWEHIAGNTDPNDIYYQELQNRIRVIEKNIKALRQSLSEVQELPLPGMASHFDKV